MPSRYTAAYSRFVARLSEVEILLTLARRSMSTDARHPNPKNFALTNTLCRSGVVLLCSHIEGYVEDLGELAIDQISARSLSKSAVGPAFRYHLSRDIINEIRQASEPKDIVRGIDKLIQRDGYVWDSSPQFAIALSSQVFIADFDNPKHNRVCKFFARFGYEDFNRDLKAKLKADYSVCTNMIEQVIDQRNKIAHGNFAIATTPNELAEMIRLVKLYCRETDQMVGKWFANRKCPLR